MTETAVTQLPDEVAELLEPIEGDSPTGQDANNAEEYFKLDMEIGKVSPNYKLCAELAASILSEKSKDLWTASWLSFAWFRLEGITGFKNGLLLILNLLKKYGEKIHPKKPNYRSKAVQFLNSGRFCKLLEKEEIEKSNADAVIEVKKIFTELAEECSKQFSQNKPVLKAIEAVIDSLKEKADEFTDTSPEKAKSETAHKNDSDKNESEIKEKQVSPDVNKESAEVVKEEKVSSAKTVKTAESKSAAETAPTTDKSAIAAIRTSIKYFFEDNDEEKKLKIPDDPFIYSLSRNLIWGRLVLPPAKENITQIDPPNAVIQTKIAEWYNANEWQVLIPRIELNFLNPDSGFQYWLDAQKYLVKALEQKGGTFIKAAEEIKISLALFLRRFPQVPELKFKNKETSFADKDTTGWIDSEVTVMLGNNNKEKEPMLLPPIMGEDYKPINDDYEKAFKELPNNFEANVAKMQNQISGDTRRKGRFLRQLNLANLCVEAKQYQLAKVHLLQLNEKIEQYNLAEWEPALCVSVWQSAYLVNKNLIEAKDKEGKNLLESEQSELFAKIANYDGVLAIKLSNKN